MKRLTTLTGKNLPKLSVGKPGWPVRILTDEEKELARQQLRAGNKMAMEVSINRGATPHPRIAKIKSAKALADFTRVCDQTGLSERLRVTWGTKKPRQPEG